MDLREYLFRKRLKPKDIAANSYVGVQMIRNYVAGRSRISLKTARFIAAATGNEVTVEELLENNPPKKLSSKDSN